METLINLHQRLPPFAFDTFKLLIWLLALMIIFVPLERLFSRHRQKVFRKAFLTDLCYFFLNSLVPRILLVVPMSVVAGIVHYLIPGNFYSAIADIPFWLRLIAALLVGEVGSYFGHRLMHEVPLLWRFHAIHHSAEAMDWLVNTRAHPLDIIFTRLCGLVPVYMLGLAQPSAGMVDLVPMLYALVGSVWGFFIHSNINWRLRWLEQFVSTPVFHHWHHAQQGSNYENKNYAAIFPWIDKLFGTLHLPAQQWPVKYGIDASMSEGLASQLVQPFRHGSESTFIASPSAHARTTRRAP